MQLLAYSWGKSRKRKIFKKWYWVRQKDIRILTFAVICYSDFMRIAYLECFSGISGDMFLGALIDAGVPPELFISSVEALGVDAVVGMAVYSGILVT